jgi:hypothetical protein
VPFIARYYHHYIWLALAATALAVVGWIILSIPLASSPLPFGIKFGLACSGPVNFLVIPLVYHLLPHRPDSALFLRTVGLITGFGAPYLCVLVWRQYDMAGLIPRLRGDNIVDNFLLIPFMVYGALAGIACAKFFVRFGDLASIFDINAVVRAAQGRD